MLTFAVVVSCRGGSIPARVLDRLRDRACADVPFDVGSHLVWSNDRGSVWFAGWQDAADGGSTAHHWYVDDESLTAFAGHLWPRSDGWRGTDPWAKQLAEHLRSTPLSERTDDLAGVFVATSLHRTGRCSVAADPLGIGLVYWGEGREVIVISSRAALAAGLLAAEEAGDPKRDTIGTGWLTYGVHAMGLRTGFERITVVPGGSVVDLDPAGGARLLDPPREPWRIQAEYVASPVKMLEEARCEMTTAIRMAAASPGAKSCAGLTGGKDSRLILALLLAEGSAEEFEFQTIGEDDLPDVLVAKQIAAAFGLRLVVNPDRAESWAWRQTVDAAVRDGGHADASSREIGFRITAWTTSGSQNVAQSHLGRPPSRDRVLLSGACGEALRTNYPGSTRFRAKKQVANLPTELMLGAAGILRPAVLAHYRQGVHTLLFDGCGDRDSPQDAVDAFYIRNRLRRWFGTTQEVDSQNRVFPLYSMTAVRLAFAIGAENRHAEWVHYQLMRQACEPLVHMPFATGGWHAGADGKLVRSRRHRESPPPLSSVTAPMDVTPTTKLPARTVAADRRAKLRELDVEIMRRFLCDDPSNPVFELIDPVATAQALDRFGSLHERQRMQLYGALTAAVWLGGHEIALPRHLARAAR